MKILFESLDPVLITAVRAELEHNEIISFIFDESMSMVEGSINLFQKKVMVVDDEYDDAKQIYQDILANYK